MDQFTRDWIIKNAKEILEEYYEGMTVRQLHYRLVSRGMTNDLQHYKRVVGAMVKARWNGTVHFSDFIDRDRSMYGETTQDEIDLNDKIDKGKHQVKAWMESYRLNRWSNQENYVEVWIEKKALQGVFESPCLFNDVGLAPCKGYPSLSFLYEALPRFKKAIETGKTPIILYFGDYDPSGQNIPETIKENLSKMGVDVILKPIALNQDQIKEMNLPGVPAKTTDSRSNNWTGGNVVELDAIEPKTLKKMCEKSIREHFNTDLFDELKIKESEEKQQYTQALKDYVRNMELD